jgi:uncharacterized repeat protein (TIGR03847 family)
VTVIVEKQQVQLLATSVLELLAEVGQETSAGPSDDEMALESPIDPRFRAGRLSIGFDPEQDRFLLEIAELGPDADEDDPMPLLETEEAETIRLWASREQMLALSRYGSAVAERGRPSCQFCGNPIDPEGHVCPATNGHRKPRV